MFSNDFGEISLDDSILLILLKGKYDIKSCENFIENLEKIYLSLDKDFSIISDLSKVNFLCIPTRINYKIAEFFSQNCQISEKYLKSIKIITNCYTLTKILNSFFYLYKMPHPIVFENYSLK
tara:strand:+ start:248 stop:613 length:366 start_codon:yes stop_codon:yes gene_type:complete